MIKVLLVTIILATTNTLSFTQLNYPIPTKNADLMFYLQRSHNRNTVLYHLNRLLDGKINTSCPFHIYWIRYEENDRIAELSFIQRRAFGISISLMEKSNVNFIFHFNSFKKKEIFLLSSKDNTYKAYTRINGEMSELEKLYIKSENNSLGIPLTIGYVELSGKSLKSGQIISEKIIP